MPNKPPKKPGKKLGVFKGPSGRSPTIKVKTRKRRKTGSNQWLERHLNDPYVQEAQKLGYRSRSAFKLVELDDKLKLIKKNMMVLDLGSAPGGWSQIAVERGAKKVVAIDLLEMDPIPGVTFLQMDFMDDDAPEALIAAMGAGADLVLSDMAPNTTGHRDTDHLRIMGLVEAAYEFAKEVLKPGGGFVAKVFQGGAQQDLLAQMKRDFSSVKHVKPPSSRKESSEQYLVATGFRAKPE